MRYLLRAYENTILSRDRRRACRSYSPCQGVSTPIMIHACSPKEEIEWVSDLVLVTNPSYSRNVKTRGRIGPGI